MGSILEWKNSKRSVETRFPVGRNAFIAFSRKFDVLPVLVNQNSKNILTPGLVWGIGRVKAWLQHQS